MHFWEKMCLTHIIFFFLAVFLCKKKKKLAKRKIIICRHWPLRSCAFLPVAEHFQHLDAVVQHAFARCGEAYERLCAAVYEDARAEFFRQIKEGVAT